MPWLGAILIALTGDSRHVGRAVPLPGRGQGRRDARKVILHPSNTTPKRMLKRVIACDGKAGRTVESEGRKSRFRYLQRFLTRTSTPHSINHLTRFAKVGFATPTLRWPLRDPASSTHLPANGRPVHEDEHTPATKHQRQYPIARKSC
jgi:hypothetical protein